MQDESMKYHTSSTGSTTISCVPKIIRNKIMNKYSALLFFSTGIRGSLPIGQPKYHGLAKALLKIFKIVPSVIVYSANSEAV